MIDQGTDGVNSAQDVVTKEPPFAIDAVRVLTASLALGNSTVGFGHHCGRLGGIHQ